MANSRPNNRFYQLHLRKFEYALIILIVLLLGLAGFVLYQLTHRPLPAFYALTNDGKQLTLKPYDEPSQIPTTILRWASKGAVAAYTFGFATYKQQLAALRPYFTADGWDAYNASVAGLIQTVVQNQIFVNGVVSGPPVIASQGYEFGRGYVWHVQLPFLVTYQTAEITSQKNYLVLITIVKVPTQINPQGIGIDEFIMGSR